MPQESSQYQEPTTGVEVFTWSARSTAALLAMCWLKYKMIGMPTP